MLFWAFSQAGGRSKPLPSTLISLPQQQAFSHISESTYLVWARLLGYSLLSTCVWKGHVWLSFQPSAVGIYCFNFRGWFAENYVYLGGAIYSKEKAGNENYFLNIFLAGPLRRDSCKPFPSAVHPSLCISLESPVHSSSRREWTAQPYFIAHGSQLRSIHEMLYSTNQGTLRALYKFITRNNPFSVLHATALEKSENSVENTGGRQKHRGTVEWW